MTMELRKENQLKPVGDEVQALMAVIRPILLGVLLPIKKEALDDAGGLANIRVRQLPRLYRQGDGDIGICFEYAVHEAILHGHPDIVEKLDDAVTRCNIRGADNLVSLLFGAEKTGSIQIIDSIKNHLTDESRLLYGSRGQPCLLKRHIDSVASAFRRTSAQAALPDSIKGLWKADLFLGKTAADKWVGTTVKINSSHLEGAKGLRIGIVPSREGRSDTIRHDPSKNLIVCPLPYDASFMEIFYRGWIIVQQFIAADSRLPKEAALPIRTDREICRYLEDRREYPVIDVVESMLPLAQPELLDTSSGQLNIDFRRLHENSLSALLAPVSLKV